MKIVIKIDNFSLNFKTLINKLKDKKDFFSEFFVYLSILFVSFFVLAPMVLPRVWPLTHEKFRYIFLIHEFRDAVLNGFIYPRWLPDLYGGYGYPTFVFYQPGFFFLATPFSLLPGYPLITMYMTIAFLLFIGGLGAYKLCKELSDSFTGFFCSVLFLLTPYLFVNLYVRGDLTELMAMLLCPLSFFFLIKITKSKSKKEYFMMTVALVASLSAIILSHLVVAMFLFISFCLTAVLISFNLEGSRKKISLKLNVNFILAAFLGMSLSLLFTSPYWLVVFQMRDYVNLDWAFEGYYSATGHTVYPHQFFSSFWGFGGSTINDAFDKMSFQLGLIHFILATIGFFLGRRNKIISISYVLYILFIILMTPYMSFLWENIEFLIYVQFPWRILSLTATLQVICITGLRNVFDRLKIAKNKFLVLLAILLVFGLWHYNQFSVGNSVFDVTGSLNYYEYNKFYSFYSHSGKNEFLPLTALNSTGLEPRGNNSLIILSNSTGNVKALDNSTKYRLSYLVNNTQPTNLLINQLYFPGWRVFINGEEISSDELEQGLTSDGRMQVFLLTNGEHFVEAFYDGPPGWRLNFIIIFIAFLGLIVYFFNNIRR